MPSLKVSEGEGWRGSGEDSAQALRTQGHGSISVSLQARVWSGCGSGWSNVNRESGVVQPGVRTQKGHWGWGGGKGPLSAGVTVSSSGHQQDTLMDKSHLSLPPPLWVPGGLRALLPPSHLLCPIPGWGRGLPGGSVVKNLPASAGDTGLIPGSGRTPWRRKWQPTPVFLLGEALEPGMLQSMGSLRVGHDFVTERQQTMGLPWWSSD